MCFAKQELITRTKRRIQHFATGKNFAFNQRHEQRKLLFFSGKFFYKRNRKLSLLGLHSLI